MTVITRFAPSPTGYLHIGSARTALFNYLFAKKNQGKFFLRIEDTDKNRSTKEATNSILASIKWLGLDYDGKIIYQSKREAYHQEAAQRLVKEGKAYLCFSSQEEISTLRKEAFAKRKSFIFQSPWRDIKIDKHPKNIKPVIRLKSPKKGETIVKDLVQGDISVENSHLDDMILLRSDGSPTYMLAVVVDDHDMGVTHIIRGDDHLSNTHRQQLLYQALGYAIPSMIHIPLIHGANGIKLSKRHGDLGIDSYQKMGYLPEAMFNYLLRLGWSCGNEEIIPKSKAIELFDVTGLGKSPSKLDFDKMKFLNAHYLREKSDEELTDMVVKMIEENQKISSTSRSNILKAMASLKIRAELLVELQKISMMYVVDCPINRSKEAKEIIAKTDEKLLQDVKKALANLANLQKFDKKSIQEKLKELAKNNSMKLGELMYFVRAFMAGDIKSPSIFEMIEILGLENSLYRLSCK